MSVDITEHEPVCAMHARGPDEEDRWFYPGDVKEARMYAEEYGARPVYPWRDSKAPGPLFPWTRAEVTGQ